MATNFYRASGIVLDGSHGIVCLGNSATYNTSATDSTIVGYNAGGTIGTSNTIIGANASLTTGASYVTLLGANTSNACTGTSYSVCLGYGATTSYTGGAFVFGSGPTTGAYVTVRESGPHMYYTANTVMTGTSTSQTVSALQVLDGIMVAQYSASGTISITLPTASAMMALIPNAIAGYHFYGKILNNNSNSRSIRILSNTSSGTFTYKGIDTFSVGQSGNYVVKVINPATPSLIFYN